MARVLPLALGPVVLLQLRAKLLQVCAFMSRHLFVSSVAHRKSVIVVADGYRGQVLNRLAVVISTSPSRRDLLL